MKIIKGRKFKPLAMMVYGIHGIGKSTFPTEAPNPIYIGSEENDELAIDRLPKIKKWGELIEQLKFLLEEEHDYKTLVVDTIDALEQVAQVAILEGQNGKTMATAFGGFGKAYEKMYVMFLSVRDDYLVKLREDRKMNIVLLAHADKSKHEDPITMTSYDTYSTAIHKKIKPIFEDWVSAILFATWQLYKTEDNSGKERAIGDGSRVIYTEERPSYISKNRWKLPFEITFKENGTWDLIANHVRKFYKTVKQESGESEGVIEIKKAIEELIAKIDPDIKEQTELSYKRAKSDITELKRIFVKLQKLTK